MLWVLAAQAVHHPRFGGGSEGPFFLISLVLALSSFMLSVMSIVYSNRGLDVSNNYNRGQATAGLVCGIITLVLSTLSGLFFTCVGIFFFSARFGG